MNKSLLKQLLLVFFIFFSLISVHSALACGTMTITGNPSAISSNIGYTNRDNILSSDNVYASSTAVTNSLIVSNYSFGLGTQASICAVFAYGYIVFETGYSTPATTSLSLSWDGGTSWTNSVLDTTFTTGSEQNIAVVPSQK